MSEEKSYTVRELTAVFYGQWKAPQVISKYEERMFTDLIDALEQPDRCQCIGEDGRFKYACDLCPR
jgi:hypothetical protein